MIVTRRWGVLFIIAAILVIFGYSAFINASSDDRRDASANFDH